ncbi:MAG: ABC transporter permease [Thiohalomonadales bacterium]
MNGLSDRTVFIRWYPIWFRHAKVWFNLIGPALIGNIGEPLLYLFGLGYGLGFFIGTVDGLDYVTFLATGILCSSAMNTASFEGMYSAYTRMSVQYTWNGMLSTPLNVHDIILGEAIWGGTKSLISGIAILAVASLMGLVDSILAIWVLPIVFLIGVCFNLLGLIVTSMSHSYDFFLYYFTLVLTPMLLLSGVFFPIEQMPVLIQTIANFLPLAHAIQLVRPLMTGGELNSLILHLSVLFLYIVLAYPIAVKQISKRLMD